MGSLAPRSAFSGDSANGVSGDREGDGPRAAPAAAAEEGCAPGVLSSIGTGSELRDAGLDEAGGIAFPCAIAAAGAGAGDRSASACDGAAGGWFVVGRLAAEMVATAGDAAAGDAAAGDAAAVTGPGEFARLAASGAGVAEPDASADDCEGPCDELPPPAAAGRETPATWARPDHCGSFGSLIALRTIAGPPMPVLTVS